MRFLFVLLFAGMVLAAPLAVSAANVNFFGPIVPDGTNGQPNCNCPGSAPDWGCVLAMIQNLMAFAISIGVLIVTLMMAYAGILWITSPFNPHNREEGRNLLMNSVIGLVITLCAWLIVDFVMKALYNPAAGGRYTEGPALPWNSILGDGSGDACLDEEPLPTPSQPNGGGQQGGGQPGGEDPGDDDPPVVVQPQPGGTAGSTCPGCASLASLGFVNGTSAKGPASACGGSGACVLASGCDDDAPRLSTPAAACQLEQSFGAKLKEAMTSSTWVSEAWPPTRSHSNDCHANGTCADVSFRAGLSSDVSEAAVSINNFISRAVQRNLGPVFEVSSSAYCEQLVDAGVNEGYLDVVPGITGNHFSVYPNRRGAQPGCD